MSKEITRRDFGKLAAAGAVGAGLGAALGEAPAQAAFVDRVGGVTLTGANWGDLVNCRNLGSYRMIKAVTEWGLFDRNIKDSTVIRDICNLTEFTLVRTGTGDRNFIDPSKVVEQITPWYQQKADKTKLLIELGNEPNTIMGKLPDGRWWWQAQSWDYRNWYIWTSRWYLREAIRRCRSSFPYAKVICTSLAPRTELDINWFLDVWRRDGNGNISADSPIGASDFLAPHAYTYKSWYESPDLGLVVNSYNTYGGTKPWIFTEIGMYCRTPSICDDYTKGYRMAGMLHFGESSPVIPSKVWGMTYFQLNTPLRYPEPYPLPTGTDPASAGYAYYYPNADWNYAERYRRRY